MVLWEEWKLASIVRHVHIIITQHVLIYSLNYLGKKIFWLLILKLATCPRHLPRVPSCGIVHRLYLSPDNVSSNVFVYILYILLLLLLLLLIIIIILIIIIKLLRICYQFTLNWIEDELHFIFPSVLIIIIIVTITITRQLRSSGPCSKHDWQFHRCAWDWYVIPELI